MAINPTPSASSQKLTLTVNTKGRVYPTKSLCVALRLKHGQPIELVPPRQRNGGCWHLDARPITPQSTLSLLVAGRFCPQFQSRYPLSPRHFKDPNTQGKMLDRIVLEFDPEQQVVEGYFKLLPLRHTPILQDHD